MRALFQTLAIQLQRVGKFGQQPVDDRAVDIVAAEMSIAVGREDLEDPSLMLRIEMSKVPPPKSNTATLPVAILLAHRPAMRRSARSPGARLQGRRDGRRLWG